MPGYRNGNRFTVILQLEMGIEPNNAGSVSVRFSRCYSWGSVRVNHLHSLGSVRVRLMTVSQLRIWFGHSCNFKKLGALEKSNTCNKNTKRITHAVPWHMPMIRNVTVHSSKFKN